MTYKDPDSWHYGGIKRRDFKASHDGPEELPYKKKAKKYRRSRCEHDFVQTIESVHRYETADRIRVYIYRNYKCSKCHKRDYKCWYHEERKK